MLSSPGLEGVVLRYGNFYGPGTALPADGNFVQLGRLAAGEVGASLMTPVRGASNPKAKEQLGWEPRYRSWRAGFQTGLWEGAAAPEAA